MLGIPHDFVTDRYAIIRHGGGGAGTTLVCGAVRFDHPAARSLIALLPSTIHLAEPDRSGAEWLPATLRMMAAEAAELRPGGETVLTRLADVLVIQAIRAWLAADPGGRTGWLGALRDRQIGRALALVHREPARDWTVAALAAECAMSRSAFAARFTELVGEPAMQYVTRWRMQTALHELSSGDSTVAELAGRLGYRSEAAFSRAFKRVFGIAPGAARQAGAAWSRDTGRGGSAAGSGRRGDDRIGTVIDARSPGRGRSAATRRSIRCSRPFSGREGRARRARGSLGSDADR